MAIQAGGRSSIFPRRTAIDLSALGGLLSLLRSSQQGSQARRQETVGQDLFPMAPPAGTDPLTALLQSQAGTGTGLSLMERRRQQLRQQRDLLQRLLGR